MISYATKDMHISYKRGYSFIKSSTKKTEVKFLRHTLVLPYHQVHTPRVYSIETLLHEDKLSLLSHEREIFFIFEIWYLYLYLLSVSENPGA